MEAMNKEDNLAQVLLEELRKTTPNVYLGFPPPEELKRLRNERFAAYILREERLEGERKAQFEKLKQAALANVRKNQL